MVRGMICYEINFLELYSKQEKAACKSLRGKKESPINCVSTQYANIFQQMELRGGGDKVSIE